MDSERAQAVAERDQLWASLRALRAEIDSLAQGKWDGSDGKRRLFKYSPKLWAPKWTSARRKPPRNKGAVSH